MPAATSRNLCVHTPAATARLLRELTENLAAGRANDVKKVPTFLGAVASSDADALLQALVEATETPCTRTRQGAFRIAVELFKSLPPHLIAPHALPLARALRQSSIPAAKLALAACVTSIAPLRAGSVDADTLVAGVVDLSCVRIELDDDNIHSLRPSLIVALSCLAAAPSLMRSRIDAIRAACWNRGFHSPCRNTRSIAVKVASRIILAHSLKTRDSAAATIVETLDAKIDEGDAELKSLDENDLLVRFESLSQLIVDILRSPAPVVLRYPLARIVNAFISALHLTDVDPLAISQLPPSLAPERVLSVLPDIHSAVLRAVPDILGHVGRSEAMPCIPIFVNALGGALLDNAVQEDSSPQRILVAASFRCQLYDTVATFGRISPASTVELARALAAALNADIKLLTILREARVKAINAAVGGGRTDGSALGGAARKRRRSNKAGEAAHRFATSGAAASNDMGERARSVARDTAMAGARAAGALLSAGVLVGSGGQAALRALEKSLETVVALTGDGTSLLSATILAGGSGVGRAKACPLLRSALVGLPRWNRNALHVSSENSPVVMAAVDSMLHPRASALDSMEGVARSGGTKPSGTGGSSRIRARTIQFEKYDGAVEEKEANGYTAANDGPEVMDVVEQSTNVEMGTKKRRVDNDEDKMETETTAPTTKTRSDAPRENFGIPAVKEVTAEVEGESTETRIQERGGKYE